MTFCKTRNVTVACPKMGTVAFEGGEGDNRVRKNEKRTTKGIKYPGTPGAKGSTVSIFIPTIAYPR